MRLVYFLVLLTVMLLDVRIRVDESTYYRNVCHSIMVTGNVSHRYCYSTR